MSEFFNSDIIKDELLGINRLQEQVYKSAFSFDSMDREERLDHIENLTELLEKQFDDVGEFSMDNMDKGLPVKEVNYIVFIQIKDELWLREMFNKAYRKEV